jgi:DNA-binding NtrC family response regulator
MPSSAERRDTFRAAFLAIEQGPGAGSRLRIGEGPRIVGRAADADLVLVDPFVSRRHLVIERAKRTLSVKRCPGAAPCMVNDRATEEAKLEPGDELVIGDTRLRFVLDDEAASANDAAGDASAAADVTTLLGGNALDARGLLGVFALVESLDQVHDIEGLKEQVREWARTHAHASAVGFAFGDTGDEAHPVGIGPSEVLVAGDGQGGTTLTVPAHAGSNGWITFRLPARPDDVRDPLRRLLVVIGRICASRVAQLRALHAVADECESLRTIALGSAHEFLGSSAGAQQVARVLPRLSGSDAAVLLTGETGTGKSFVARLIHEGSARSAEPLRVLNCAAIPESLIESELFGYERGAFSGAVARRVGALEAAGGGTLFLDEIGELPLASQAKLLRVLEDKKFERIGSNRTIDLRARVIAATNRDLEQMVAQKLFRDDLYFRISVVRVRVPALRERAEDIPLLAERILSDLSATSGRRVEGFSPDAIALLNAYPWPGNVRELRNAIEHAMVMGDTQTFRPSDFPEALLAWRPASPASQPRGGAPVNQLPLDLARLEQNAIEEALRVTSGNRTRAAAMLGISRSCLHNKLREMGQGAGAAGEDEP